MLLSGGPYQTNPEMISKMRDLAAIVNRIHMLDKNAQPANSDMKRLQDSIEYASPPVRNRPKERQGRADVLTPEHEVSPVITGLHDKDKRQPHRMRTPGSTGARTAGGGSPSTSGTGAHRT